MLTEEFDIFCDLCNMAYVVAATMTWTGVCFGTPVLHANLCLCGVLGLENREFSSG